MLSNHLIDIRNQETMRNNLYNNNNNNNLNVINLNMLLKINF